MSSGDNHKVSLIVVNWNDERFLKDCLGALCDQSYGNREIILVDNGSSDNSVRFARESFPEVKVIALRENKGFTGGNAVGLEIAQGAYIALVNNDARVDKAWLESLLKTMLQDRSIGICAPKLIFENTNQKSYCCLSRTRLVKRFHRHYLALTFCIN
jgi:GT2 family glycosyltransferase